MATRLKIRICTWNVGHASPPSNLSAWLTQTPSDASPTSAGDKLRDLPDLVVIGVQECASLTEASTAPGARGGSENVVNNAVINGSNSSMSIPFNFVDCSSTSKSNEPQQPTIRRKQTFNPLAPPSLHVTATPVLSPSLNQPPLPPPLHTPEQGIGVSRTPSRKGSAGAFRILSKALKSVRITPRLGNNPSFHNLMTPTSMNTMKSLTTAASSSSNHSPLALTSSPSTVVDDGIFIKNISNVKRNNSAAPFLKPPNSGKMATPRWMPFRKLASESFVASTKNPKIRKNISNNNNNFSNSNTNRVEVVDESQLARARQASSTSSLSTHGGNGNEVDGVQCDPLAINDISLKDLSAHIESITGTSLHLRRQKKSKNKSRKKKSRNLQKMVMAMHLEEQASDKSSGTSVLSSSISGGISTRSSGLSSSSDSANVCKSSIDDERDCDDVESDCDHEVENDSDSGSDSGSDESNSSSYSYANSDSDKLESDNLKSTSNNKNEKNKNKNKQKLNSNKSTTTTWLRLSPIERRLKRTISSSLPSGYTLLSDKWMWHMGLLIYVHDKCKTRIKKTPKSGNESTGIANVVGNKGAVWTILTIDDGTRLCFINSHLAAHDGEKFREQRIRDVRDIMKGISKNECLPFINCFDHVFWFGDLNYRLDIPKFVGISNRNNNKWNDNDIKEYVKQMLGSTDFVNINNIKRKRRLDVGLMDELNHLKEKGLVFNGFQEGPLLFSPTFKVNRRDCVDNNEIGLKIDSEGWLGTEEYQMERIPAYCDRILWKSKSVYSAHVQQREYKSVPEICTSDHKPVYGIFDIVMPRRDVWMPLPVPTHAYRCTIEIISLELHLLLDSGLREKRAMQQMCSNSSSSSSDREEENEDFREFMTLQSDQSEVECDMKKRKSEITSRDIEVRFHGDGMFLRESGHKSQLKKDDGQNNKENMWTCVKKESTGNISTIRIKGVKDMNSFRYKCLTICFREGKKQKWKSSCTLPMMALITSDMNSSESNDDCWKNEIMMTNLKVCKYGMMVGSVDVKLRLSCCKGNDGDWLDWNGAAVGGKRVGKEEAVCVKWDQQQ